MRNLPILAFIFTSLAAPLALAAGAKIDIISPSDGARLDDMEQHKLVYEVTLGAGGDHAHLYVDGKETTLLRHTNSSITLDPMRRGMHEICAKMVNKNHTPIGVERCIKVTVE